MILLKTEIKPRQFDKLPEIFGSIALIDSVDWN